MLAQMSVEHVRLWVRDKSQNLTPADIHMLRNDPRKGVRELAEKIERGLREQRAEIERLNAMLAMEKELWAEGYTKVLGMDEVGRGPLAGPVTVAGVIWPQDVLVEGVNDSKVLTAKKREELAPKIKELAVAYAIASRDQSYIDEHGIVAAIQSCQREIIAELKPDCMLLDAFSLPDCPIPQKAIIKGDSKSFSIAAASIIAKVARDAYMTSVAPDFPGYGFATNKGYGCREHYDALFSSGPTTLHRRSYLGFMENGRVD